MERFDIRIRYGAARLPFSIGEQGNGTYIVYYNGREIGEITLGMFGWELSTELGEMHGSSFDMTDFIINRIGYEIEMRNEDVIDSEHGYRMSSHSRFGSLKSLSDYISHRN